MNSEKESRPWLTVALPKGRLFDQLKEYLESRGFVLNFSDRKLKAEDPENRIRFLLVKNSDLPTYITHGIAGLGFCGEDVILESGQDFMELMKLPFGSTRLMIAAPPDSFTDDAHFGRTLQEGGRITIATSYPRMTRSYFHRLNKSVDIIRLGGSVELAASLGLCSCISDLVETGTTLRANNLNILREIRKISLFFIANHAYYKLYYKSIDILLTKLYKKGF